MPLLTACTTIPPRGPTTAAIFSINVANGTWTVGVNCSGGDHDLSSLGYPCVNNQVTNISSGNAVVNFTVQPFSTFLRGRVLDDLGVPVGSMNLFAFPDLGGGAFQATTDSGGNFQMGVTGGDYALELNTDPFSGAPSRGLVSPSLPVSVTDGVDITNLTLIARRVTGAINVSVKKRQHNNVGIGGINAFANIIVNGTNYSANVTTDNSGAATLLVFNGQWDVGLDSYKPEQRRLCRSFLPNRDQLGQHQHDYFLRPTEHWKQFANHHGLLAEWNQRPLLQYPALIATGGEPPYTWSRAPGSPSLPPGLILLANGQISGTPSVSGTSNLNLRVSDSASSVVDKVLPLTINPAASPSGLSLNSPSRAGRKPLSV